MDRKGRWRANSNELRSNSNNNSVNQSHHPAAIAVGQRRIKEQEQGIRMMRNRSREA